MKTTLSSAQQDEEKSVRRRRKLTSDSNTSEVSDCWQQAVATAVETFNSSRETRTRAKLQAHHFSRLCGRDTPCPCNFWTVEILNTSSKLLNLLCIKWLLPHSHAVFICSFYNHTIRNYDSYTVSVKNGLWKSSFVNIYAPIWPVATIPACQV